MFKLINYFIKETLIAFYKIKDKYIVQKIIVKKGEVLSKEDFEFSEDEFLSFLKTSFLENTQTYVATIIDTFNQGCVDSCNHSKYRELGINLDNIKILCLKDYSIFIGLYELNQYRKNLEKFQVDYIFSPYLLLHMKNKQTPNSFYLLYTESFVTLLIYEDANKPKYSNIYQFKLIETDDSLSENNSDIDDLSDIDDIADEIEDIEEIESLDDIGDDIEDSIDDIDDIESSIGDIDEKEDIQDDIINTKNEIETIEFIKNSIKDYYESYSNQFLEIGYILYDNDISSKFVKNIEEETFLDIKQEKVELLDMINELSLKELNV